MGESNKIYKKCQSCAITISNNRNKGTNNDGSLNIKYCYHCYQDGRFTQPHINCEEMQQISFNFFKREHPIMAFFFGKSYVRSIAKLERWNQKNK